MMRTALLAGLVVLASAVGLQAQDSQAPQLLEWRPATTIPTAASTSIAGDAYDYAHMLQVADNGSVREVRYSVIYNYPTGPDHFSTSPEVLDSVSGSYETLLDPLIWVDNQNAVNAVWIYHNSNQTTRLEYRRKTASGWGTIQHLVTDEPNLRALQLQVDTDGKLYVLCERILTGSLISNFLLVVKTGSNTVKSELLKPENPIYPWDARFSVRNGSLYAALLYYVSDGPPKWRVYQSSLDSQGAWSTPLSYGDDDDCSDPDVAIDHAGTPHFLWNNQQEDTLKYRRLGSSPVTLNTQTTYGGRIVVDAFNRANVFTAGMYHFFAPDAGNPVWGYRAYFGMPQLGEPVQAVVSRGSRFHVIDSQSYTTTHNQPSGMDGASWVPAFPGGSVNVVPVSGKLQYTLDLFSTKGVAPSQSFRLTYNSRENGASQLAPGWTMSYLMYLDYDALSNTATLVLPNGFRLPVPLDENGAGAYHSFGFACSVQKQTAGWSVKVRGGREFSFGAGGKLGSIVDPTGNRIDVATGEAGQIGSVTDQLGNGGSGRTTQILYRLTPNDPLEDRIRVVVDPDGKRYEIYYTNGNLTSVVFASHPDRPTYSFQYEQYGLVTKVLPPRGSAATTPYGYSVFYDSRQRVEHIEDPLEKYLLDTEGDAVQPADRTAEFWVYYDDAADTMVAGKSHSRVENRRQKPTIYAFDRLHQYETIEIWDAVAIAAANDQTPVILPVVRTYDENQNVLTESNRWGKTTRYTYVQQPPRIWMKNLLEKVEKPLPSGEGFEEVESFTYTQDDFGNVETHTTRATPADGGATKDRTTIYEYNEYSQRTFIHYPDLVCPDNQEQSDVYTEFQYNGARRQLTRMIDEEGRGTNYSSFDSLHGLAMSALRDGGSQPELTQYDAMGNIVQTKRPQGGSQNAVPDWTVFGLDELYRVHTITDPAGKITTNTYDLDSNLVSVQPPAGEPTTTVFDKRGIVSGGTTPDGTWNQFVDAQGNARRKTTLRGYLQGYATNTDFDSLDRAIETRVPGASTLQQGGGGGPTMVTQWVHDGLDETGRYTATTVVGSPNRVTKTIFDNRGRAKQVLAADDKTRTDNFYDEQDQLVATQLYYDDVFQTCTVTFRDDRDRVDHVRVQDAAYGVTPTKHSDTYTLYDKAGFVRQTVDPLGNVAGAGYAHKTTFIPDARGRVYRVLDGYGVTVKENLYGDDDLLIEVKVPDPATKSTTLVTAETRTYTGRKELWTVKNRGGVGVTNAYTNIQGQIDTMTDAFGIVTKTTYDADTLRVDEVIEAQGTANERRTKSVWQNGLLSETRVWNPATLSYSSSYRRYYDQADRLERYEAPLVAAERYFYNAFGEQNQTIIGAKTVTHTFNALGQRTDSQWSGAYSDHEVRTYNSIGLPETVSAASRAKTMYYDVWLGTPNDETFSVGGNVWKLQTHTYDVARNYTHFEDAEGKVHEWKRDDNNRVHETWYDGNKINDMTFTPGGLVDVTTLRDALGNAIAETTMTYDGLGRKTRQQTLQLSTGNVVADLEWGYNALDLVTSIQFHHLGAEVTLGYNERRELTSEVQAGNGSGQTPPPYTNQIGGPATGNESTPSNEAQSAPQAVLTVSNRSATYVFDPAGNRTSQTIDGVTTTFEHNEASQLVSETATGRSATHEYDEWGNEIERVEGTTVETYGYNYLNLMSYYANSTTSAEWQYDFWPTGERYAKTNLSTNVAEIYIPRAGDVATEYDKPDGGAIAFKNRYVQGIGIDQKHTRISSTGDRRHYIGDQVGTVDVTLTDTGAVAESGLKDAWGVQLAGGTPSERYGFAQREHDAESGLVHMRARMYDPKLGRFTQTDPIFQNRARKHYTYATNNPVGRTDPMGLWDSEFGTFWEEAWGVAKSLGRGVVEPIAVLGDIGTAGLVKAHNLLSSDQIYAEDVQMVSGTGERLRNNVVEDKGWVENARAGVVLATAVPTGGGSVLADNIAQVFEENMSPEEARVFLTRGAITQSAGAAVGVGVSKVTGGGWTGRGEAPAPTQLEADGGPSIGPGAASPADPAFTARGGGKGGHGGPFDPNQRALVELAKEAKQKGGVTPTDAETLTQWAKEYDLPQHEPMSHPGRGAGGQQEHINVGPVKHIPVKRN